MPKERIKKNQESLCEFTSAFIRLKKTKDMRRGCRRKVSDVRPSDSQNENSRRVKKKSLTQEEAQEKKKEMGYQKA